MRIFIIGFNKTATRTLHYFFKGNGLNAIHWDDGNLVEVFERNIKLGKKLLFDGVTLNKEVNSDCKYEDAIVFSDMTSYGSLIVKDPKDYYKQLDKEYPNSKFILNIRDVDSWILSRLRHITKNLGGMLERDMKFYKCDMDNSIKRWRLLHSEHTTDVISYFKNRPNDLLIYNIFKDNPQKIVDFFKDIYKLDLSYWNHIGKAQ